MDRKNKRVLGVVGGMGPVATAWFTELIVRMTEAEKDQDHLDMIIYSRPSLPDRTAYILDRSKSNPVPYVISTGNKLADLGAERIALPCVTIHCFIRELKAGIHVPIVDCINATVSHLKENGVTKAGVMATDGAVKCGLFYNELKAWGIEAIFPSAFGQKAVMSLIYENIKAGRPADMERFFAAVKELRGSGAQVLILGCTELSLIKRDNDIGPGYIDVMEVLAAQSILCCEGKLKEEYKNLITH